MTGLLSALRGLAHRAGISLSILLVAVVAVAAVTIGPTYYTAAQSSILQDTVNQSQVTGRGLEVNQSGSAAAISTVTRMDHSVLAAHLGGAAVLHRIFAAPVTAAETTVQAHAQTVPLVYRSGVCAHLRFTAGHCPSGVKQVAVSSSLAFLFHWHLGQRVAVAVWKHLTITGVYRITAAAGGPATGSTRPAATSRTRTSPGHPPQEALRPTPTTRCSPRCPRCTPSPGQSRALTMWTSR